MAKRIQKLGYLYCYEANAYAQDHPDFRWSGDGWIFAFLGRVFEYYMQGKLVSPNHKVLHIKYFFDIPGPLRHIDLLDAAFWNEAIIPFNFSKMETVQEKLAAGLDIFEQTLEKAFAFYEISGSWQEIIQGMRDKNFLFSENIKKINRDWSFRWRYADPQKGVEFYFFNARENREVPMCRQRNSIFPRYWFPHFSLQDEKFKIALRLSDQYWSFDLKSERVRYVHPRAEAGQAHSQYNLGKEYLSGKNFPEAKRWLEKAAAQGFSRAASLLERINSPDFCIEKYCS